MLAAQRLASPFAEVEALLMQFETGRTGKPFALGLFLGEGLEHALRRMFPMAGDGEAGMGDGTRHSSFSFDIMQTNHAVFERPVAGQFQARLGGAVEIRQTRSQQDGVLENPEFVYRLRSG